MRPKDEPFIERPGEYLLKPGQAAEYIGLTTRFLEMRRHLGDGPQYVRISARCIRYRKSDLDAWIEDRVRASTSDDGGAS